MYSILKSELVDPEMMAGEEDAGRREALLENLASLFVLTHQTCSAEQLEVYDNILLNLIELVAAEARARLSAILAPLDKAPPSTIRRLAVDVIYVARPVLVQSPILDDIDLQYICQTHTDDHMLAISERVELSEAVSDTLVARGGNQVLQSLTRNTGATISDFGFRSLIESARGDESLQEAIAMRADFPGHLVAALAEIASEKVKVMVAGLGGLDEGTDPIDCAKVVVLSKMQQSASMAYYDFDSARDDVRRKLETDELTPEVMERFARDGQFAHVVYVHSHLAGISEYGAMTELTWAKPGLFIASARALGYPEATVVAVLNCGPWQTMLDDVVRAVAVVQFRRMPYRLAVSQFETQKGRFDD
ncbi:MAG: DUF2336 domain-containing protein [Rhodobiaceae bacterium]|nr:DUF2336 domain-containing protein [Rhodobiaceae bacterium]